MATITPIKNSKKGAYRITVSNGYDSNNKQIRISTTFTPDKTKSQRQQEKQVQEFAKRFEGFIKSGGTLKSFNLCEQKRKEHIERTLRYFDKIKQLKCPVIMSAEPLSKECNLSRAQIVKIVKQYNLPIIKIGENKMMINKFAFFNFLNGGGYENCEWYKYNRNLGIYCTKCM